MTSKALKHAGLDSVSHFLPLRCLSSNERSQLQAMAARSSFVVACLAQLERILTSSRFQRVQEKARHLFAYVVAKKLLGHTEQIKEVALAIRVFRATADFNPAETATVRMAAYDMRRRLAAYAAEEGRCDPIEIVMRRNTYVPVISDRRQVVVMSTFENWQASDQRHVAVAIGAEVAHQLSRAGLPIAGQDDIGPDANNRYVVRGSLEGLDDRLKLRLSVADVRTGRTILSTDFEGNREDCFVIARSAAGAVMEAIDFEPRGCVRQRSAALSRTGRYQIQRKDKGAKSFPWSV